MKKKLISVTALLLAAAVLLSGCLAVPSLPQVTTREPLPVTSTQTPEPPATTELPATETDPIETVPIDTTEEPTVPATEPFDPNDEALIRWKNAGQKDFLPDEPIDMVKFSEMEYVRPDVETLFSDFDRLAEEALTSKDADALLEGYYDLYDRYISFYSMDSLANIRYSLNTTDSFYKDEYDYCEEQSPDLEAKFEALNKAFAASPSRDALEKSYFGKGYFKQYDDYEVYTNPEYLRLTQEEAALLTSYRDLTSDIQVTYNGVEKSLDEWLESTDYYEYIGALKAYYEQYNQSVGEIFLQLVKVRRQLADALDYETYGDYSYEVVYSRDYSPEQGTAFVDGIREYLVPVLKKASTNPSLMSLSTGSSTETKVMQLLESAAQNIGGTVWDAYRFMRAYELCDIAKASEKVEASFQTYIYDYEAPFVLVNAQGSGDDYFTFSHEFGHFTDSYYNYGANEDLETAETFSQAMEFLALNYTDTLNSRQQENLLKSKLLELLETFVYQGAYADFEAKVYALDPDELSIEKINDLFRQSCKDFGVYENGFDFYYSKSWIDILHFFEVPYYIISYCVSAETALQVYQLEAGETGAGIDAYFRLLDRSYDAGVQQVMEDAGLNNPFREDVLAETADFFLQELGLNQN